MIAKGEIAKRVKRGAAKGLNASADDLAGRAIAEAPVETGELRASCNFPSNAPDHEATEGNLEAMVSFNTVYAAAQHEGEMVYHRAGVAHPIVWVVKNHPGGGKSHYLEDPFKAMVPRYEEIVAASVKKAIDG